MRDVGKWRSSLPKCSKLENGRVRVIGYIGQRMAWRITLLKVVSRFYRLHSFTLLTANTTTGLINYVYPPGSLHNNVTGDFLNERAILATTNHDVAEINDSIVRDRMTGQLKFKLSADTPVERADRDVVGPEFLNSFDNPSLPPHSLCLKVGCPIMCLRNIDPVNVSAMGHVSKSTTSEPTIFDALSSAADIEERSTCFLGSLYNPRTTMPGVRTPSNVSNFLFDLPTP